MKAFYSIAIIACIVATSFTAPAPIDLNDPSNNDPSGSDHKGANQNPAFAIFDEFVPGLLRDLQVCTNDTDCQSDCCDGAICRAPDSLKPGQTCRSGLAPVFAADGSLSFKIENGTILSLNGEGSLGSTNSSGSLTIGSSAPGSTRSVKDPLLAADGSLSLKTDGGPNFSLNGEGSL